MVYLGCSILTLCFICILNASGILTPNELLEKECKNDPFRSNPRRGFQKEDCVWYRLTKKYQSNRQYIAYRPSKTKTSLNQERPKPAMVIKLQDMHLGMYYMEWIDDRLTWPKSELYDIASLPLWRLRGGPEDSDSANFRVWVPVMNQDQTSADEDYRHMNRHYPPGPYPGPGGRFRTSRTEAKSRIYFNGTVRYHTEVHWVKEVQFDYTNFPYDTQRVCFDYFYSGRESENNPELVTIDGDALVKASQKGFKKDSRILGNHYWKYAGHEMVKNKEKKNSYDFCFTIQRISPTAHIELVLPMVGASIVAMAAPAFGNLKLQGLIKLAAFFMQIYCTESFGQMTSGKRFGDLVPKLMRFQECTLVLTIISILTTAVLMIVYRTPPMSGAPHGLSSIMEKIPSFCAIEDDVEGMKTEADQSPKKTNHWASTIRGVNAISSVIFAGFYILAMVSFCTVK